MRSEASRRAFFHLGLASRLAWRELRGGFAGFRIFIACVALGVAAIVAVGSTTRALTDSVAAEGRRILGGDIAFSLIHREAGDEERAWFATLGRTTVAAGLRAMARAGDDASLVELKAVDAAYPVIGNVLTEPREPLAALLTQRNGVFGFVAEEALKARLNLSTGARIMIGDAEFEFRGLLVAEPDKLAGGVGFGPRVLVSQEGLQSSKLLQPGSLIRWTYRVTLPDDQTSSAITLPEVAEQAGKLFPNAGWQVRTRENVSNQFARNTDRFGQFLVLVGLTSLIVGGVGVANAVRAYVSRKTADFATLKSLGATGGFVFSVSLLQVIIVAGLGVVLGAAVGAALPFALAGALDGRIPIPFSPQVYPEEISLAAVYGMLTAIAFSLPPLGAAHDVPASELYRSVVSQSRRVMRLRYRAAGLAAAATLIAAVLFFSPDRRLTFIYLLATAGGYLLLHLVAAGVRWTARRAPPSRLTEARLAVSNIHRPGALTEPVVISLGLGLTLLVTLSLIDVNLRAQLREGVPGETPSFFFLDVPSDRGAEFDAFVQETAPGAKIERVPMMRGRIVRINGRPVEQVDVRQDARWVVDGDRGITYADAAPEGSSVVAGEWWPAGYAGEPLVSLEKDAATGLGLAIGDTITVNVLGRNLTARLANLRKVDWTTFGINFVFVFSPNTFKGAPHMHLATAAFPAGADKAAEYELLKRLTKAWPSVVSIRVRDTLEAIAAIAEQLSVGVRAATSIAIASAMLVLAGALSAGQKGRIYDAVVLKTLGATRRRLLTAYVLEFGALGLATALFGLLAGGLASSVIVLKVLKLDTYTWSLPATAWALGVSLAVTIGLGLLGTWRVLGQKPARRLRDL